MHGAVLDRDALDGQFGIRPPFAQPVGEGRGQLADAHARATMDVQQFGGRRIDLADAFVLVDHQDAELRLADDGVIHLRHVLQIDAAALRQRLGFAEPL